MSFSSEIKEELSKLNNLKDKQAVYYELVGYLITKNTKSAIIEINSFILRIISFFVPSTIIFIGRGFFCANKKISHRSL